MARKVWCRIVQVAIWRSIGETKKGVAVQPHAQWMRRTHLLNSREMSDDSCIVCNIAGRYIVTLEYLCRPISFSSLSIRNNFYTLVVRF